MNIPTTDRIKHLVAELDEAMRTMRQEPEEGDHPWSWDDEHAAGLNLADAAEALILALPVAIWPPSWFHWPPSWFEGKPERAPFTSKGERLIDELLERLDS
ncbi:hypothetical protein [Streptomyces sp. NPDC057552]|uniref:hypothetical protein n=1 Tax=Streptomyces sp. NPDC057552 TaxID=3350537 RepID=UPI0036924F69